MKKIYMLLAGALLWTTAGFSQNGDSCTVAVEITADGDYTVEALTGTGAIESGADAAAWFYYTATADGTINISACALGDGVDTRLWVYDGDCDALNSVASDDDGCDAPNGLASVVLDVPVVSGTTYYIAWDDRWSADGFGFNFTYVPPPACADVTGLDVPIIEETAALVEWNGDGNSAWDFAIDTAGFDIESATLTSMLDTIFAASNLTQNTFYDVYVRTNCGADGVSEWVMTTFKTLSEGDNCDLPYVVDFANDLPYGDTAQFTCGRGDTYNETCMGFYDGGEDVVYRFDLTSAYDVVITMDPKGTTWTGMGLFSSCPDAENCIEIATGSSGTDLKVIEAQLLPGSYYFMVSTWPTPDCIPDFDLSITGTEVTCTNPTGLVASETMPTQATINWNSDGNTSWDVKVDTAGFDIDAATPTTVTDTFVTTLALEADKQYDAYVRTNCGAGDVSDWTFITFTTTCVEEVMTIPYYEGFDDVTVPGMPCNWLVNNINGDDYTWETIVDQGSNALSIRWNADEAMNDMTKTPELALTGGTSYSLLFRLRTGSTFFVENLAVFYAGDDGVAIDTLINMQAFGIVNYENKIVEFTPPADGNYRIAFYGTSDADQLRITIDDIEVFETPDCMFPLAVNVLEVTSTTALVNWDNVGDEFQVVWDTVGFDPEGAIAVTVMDTVYEVMGLTPETDYEVYVRNVCGVDTNSFWRMAAFSTPATAPDNDNCDGAVTFDVTVGGDMATVTGSTVGSTDGEGFGVTNVWESFTLDACADVAIDFCGSSPVANALFINLYDQCPIGETIPQGAVTDPGCDGNLMVTFTNVPAGTYWYPVIGDASGAGLIGFEDYTMNVTATACATCMPVTNLAVAVNGVDATATWDAVGTEYDVVFGMAGIDPDAETPITVSDASFEMLDLDQSTDYEVYVRNNCGSGDVSAWEMAAFSTTAAIEGESFEGDVFPPEGWTMIDADGDGEVWFQYGFNPYAGLFSAASASWTAATGPLTPDNYLVSPMQSITENNAELSWHTAAQDPAFPADKYGVWISTTGNEEGDFTTELFVEVLATDTWEERFVDLSDYIGQDVYLAFRHYDVTDMFYMKIDNVILPDFVDAVAETENVEFSIYPNPNNGQFTIANIGATGDYLVEIIDVTGKVIYSVNQTLTSGQRSEINPGDVKMGVYLVKLTNTQENYYRTERMIIK